MTPSTAIKVFDIPQTSIFILLGKNVANFDFIFKDNSSSDISKLDFFKKILYLFKKRRNET